jgi:putative ABC transport system permease protein
MWRDLVYAYRVLKRSPIATAVTILALALGIGANTGSFIAVNAILLHPFRYPHLDRIMTVWGTLPKAGLNRAGVAAADFEDWRRQSRSFELLSAYENWTVNVTGSDHPEPVRGVHVGAGFFEVFGVKPFIGRTFMESDGELGDTRVTVLSNGLWRTRFAAAPDVIGKTISLGAQNYTIVGVAPEDFDFPLAAEVWVPLVLTPGEKADRSAHRFLAVGRLKPDVSTTQADAEIRAMAGALEREYPKTNAGWSAAVAPLLQMAESVTNRFIEVLATASLFLLLLAGANVANIQLAQAMNRRKTIIIEASLGASRFRIARSLWIQSLLLALGGGAAALIAATWVSEANRASIPAMVYQIVPGLRQLRIDSTVVLFTVALSLLTGVLCSLPAIAHLLGVRSLALTEALSQGNRSVAGDSRSRMRNLLVMGEVVMALLLLVGAGAMVNTFQHLLLLNLGFNPSKLLTAQISLNKQAYPDDAQIAGFFDRLLPESSTIPNVQSVSLEMDDGTAADFRIEGRPDPVAGDPKPDIRIVDAHYFGTMEMPLIAGRAIEEQDKAGSTPVIVISKSVADHYWPDTDPIGHRVRFGQSPWLTIVGICGDTIQWFTNEPEPAGYASYWQKPMLDARVLLRTSGDPMLAANAVVAKVRAQDPSEPVYGLKSMEQFYSEERSGVQGAARAMENNAAIALFLALTGIYGVISHFVSQRTREIGIRIAVGAATSDIMKMTLGEAGRVAGIGLAIGVIAAYLLMRVLSSVLFNVVVVKWTTFSAVTALLGAAVLLAAYIPARRAAAVDPVIALRNE